MSAPRRENICEYFAVLGLSQLVKGPSGKPVVGEDHGHIVAVPDRRFALLNLSGRGLAVFYGGRKRELVSWRGFGRKGELVFFLYVGIGRALGMNPLAVSRSTQRPTVVASRR